MTVQVDSQLVTDQSMWYMTMCCINNSIYCLEKKTTVGTHEETCYANFNVGLTPHLSCIFEVYMSGAYGSTFSRACFHRSVFPLKQRPCIQVITNILTKTAIVLLVQTYSKTSKTF